VRYEDPQWLPHDEADAIFAGADEAAICNALAGAALYDADAAWVESWCVRLGGSRSDDVRGLAATSLGHVARRFGADSLDLLNRLQGDPAVRGRADDALDDVRMFTRPAT
jgi:hypothetical protein